MCRNLILRTGGFGVGNFRQIEDRLTLQFTNVEPFLKKFFYFPIPLPFQFVIDKTTKFV